MQYHGYDSYILILASIRSQGFTSVDLGIIIVCFLWSLLTTQQLTKVHSLCSLSQRVEALFVLLPQSTTPSNKVTHLILP